MINLQRVCTKSICVAFLAIEIKKKKDFFLIVGNLQYVINVRLCYNYLLI